MSTKAAQVTTCFYLLMQIGSYLNVVFVLIFIIYLLIYSKRCQQSMWNRPPVFIYLCKSLLVTHGFHCNIQYLFVYLFKAMSTKHVEPTTCFYLLMQITCCLNVLFLLKVHSH